MSTDRALSALDGKSILVTGGTGSFGNAFVKRVLEGADPRRLVVYSRDEWKQSTMQKTFSEKQYPALRYFIGDVRDPERLRRAFNGVDIVVHAAALKQVPACEYNPFEAVQTNVIGAKNVIEAAIDRNVSHVLALSTDKAVSPVNIYGATKLCAEKLFVQGGAYAGAKGTRFACARYGNVVGSRGSVVPLFFEQRETGKVTITDERMTRFWITLEQGVQFVVDNIARMRGGEVFVPKIPSMRMTDLARVIAPKAKHEIIGIRPGEKIHETLLTDEESRHAREFKDHFVIEPEHPFWDTTSLQDGKPLPHDFRYTSDGNDHWLTDAELARMITDLGYTL